MRYSNPIFKVWSCLGRTKQWQLCFWISFSRPYQHTHTVTHLKIIWHFFLGYNSFWPGTIVSRLFHPEDLKEIEGFVTHICVTREIRAVFTMHICSTRPRWFKYPSWPGVAYIRLGKNDTIIPQIPLFPFKLGLQLKSQRETNKSVAAQKWHYN